MKSGLMIGGKLNVTVHRANGQVEKMGSIPNLIPDTGSEEYAKLLLGEASSAPAYMVVGTDSTAAVVGDTITSIGAAAAPKALSLNATSLNTLVQVATFGGDADSLTSVDLVELGTNNHASSGQGELLGRVTFSTSTVTLAASDLVKFEYVTTVGTHS